MSSESMERFIQEKHNTWQNVTWPCKSGYIDVWWQLAVCVWKIDTTEEILGLSIRELLWLIWSVQVNPAFSQRNNNVPILQTHLWFDWKGGNWTNTQRKWGHECGKRVFIVLYHGALSLSNQEHNRKLRADKSSPCAESGLSVILLLRCELRLLGKLVDSLHGSYMEKNKTMEECFATLSMICVTMISIESLLSLF